MAQTGQVRSGGTNSSETPISPEQQFEEDTKKAIALSLESAKYEEHQRILMKPSPNTSALSTPTEGARAKTPTTDDTLSGQSTSSSSVNNLDPFSMNEQKSSQVAPSPSEQDLMHFSFDHVLKNYNRQKTSPQKPHSQAASQFTLPFPVRTQNRTMAMTRTSTLPPKSRTGMTPQHSFPVQTTSHTSSNPFSAVSPTPATSSANPFANSWKPDNKFLSDLTQSSLPQSRSSPPSPTPQLLPDFDNFLLTPKPVVTKSSSGENPFTKVPHGQPLPRSAADELWQMLQDPSPNMESNPPTLPRKSGRASQHGAGSQEQDKKPQANSGIHLPPPAQTIRRISSQPSMKSLEQSSAKTTQQETPATKVFNSSANASGSSDTPPLPPKMYANKMVTDMLPLNPPATKSNSSENLIVLSPRQTSDFNFDDAFMEFDPLKMQIAAEKAAKEKAAAEKAAAAAAAAEEEDEAPALPPKSGSTSDSSDGVGRERPASCGNLKETKKEKPVRPRTVHGQGQRPKSLEMGKPEKWTSIRGKVSFLK